MHLLVDRPQEHHLLFNLMVVLLEMLLLANQESHAYQYLLLVFATGLSIAVHSRFFFGRSQSSCSKCLALTFHMCFFLAHVNSLRISRSLVVMMAFSALKSVLMLSVSLFKHSFALPDISLNAARLRPR